VLSANVPHSIVSEGRRQLRMADEYESISDYITSILKFHLKLRNQGHRFDEKHLLHGGRNSGLTCKQR